MAVINRSCHTLVNTMTMLSKPGRPLLKDEPMTERLSVRLTPNEKKILQDYCWRYDLSPSDVVRWCLENLGVIPMWMAPKLSPEPNDFVDGE